MLELLTIVLFAWLFAKVIGWIVPIAVIDIAFGILKACV